MNARELEGEFDAWKDSPNGHEWIVWLGADPQTSSITLLLIVDDQKGGGGQRGDESEEAEEIQIFYPADEQSIWYMEPKRTQHLSSSSNISVCPWANSFNEWLMANSFDREKKLTLSEVLDKVTELKYGSSIDATDQPIDNNDNSQLAKVDNDKDAELEALQKFLMAEEEEKPKIPVIEEIEEPPVEFTPEALEAHLTAYGVKQEVGEMKKMFGKKSIKLLKGTGKVRLPIRVDDVIKPELAFAVGMDPKQDVIVHLDFSYLPVSKSAQDVEKYLSKKGSTLPLPKLVIQQGENKDSFGVASYLRAIAIKYLQDTWGKKSMGKKHFRHIRKFFIGGDKGKGKEKEKDKGKGKSSKGKEKEKDKDKGKGKGKGKEKEKAGDEPKEEGKEKEDDLLAGLEDEEEKEKEMENLSSDTYIGQCAEGNFFLGLTAVIRKVLARYRDYCLICHKRHSCKCQSAVICCNEECLARFSELLMYTVNACTICPYMDCSTREKMDKKDILNAAIGVEEGEEIGSVSEDLLLNMYRHKYLPNADVKKFFVSGVKKWLSSNRLKVTKVTNVLKADLVLRFEAKWKEMRNRAKPQVAYHGTTDQNIRSILEKGLLVPGRNDNGVAHRSDTGWWGGGIYLSPDPVLSSSYSGGSAKLLVCSVLMGRTYHCKKRMDGQPLKTGYDSHVSPLWSISGNFGKEWIVFDEGQVLPCYLVEFTNVYE